MNFFVTGQTARNRRRGFTLVELMVASGVATLVLGTTMVLLIATAKENRRGVADATVEQAASDLQNKLIFYLRSMSLNGGATFGEPLNATEFKTLIMARGPAPDYPRQEIKFDAGSGMVTYNPNRATTNSSIVLIRTTAHQVLRQLSFRPSLKTDGTVDNGLINVTIKIDDNGSSGRSSSSNPAKIQRTFAVRMRNN